MPMSSAGPAVNSNGCVTKPKECGIGLRSCFVPIQSSSLTGSYVMATAEQREPYESRGSRTVLGEPGGESPPGHSTIATETRCPRYVRFSPDSDRRTDIAECLKRANKRLMHRSKQHPYSITCGRLYFVQVAALPAPRAPCWGFSVGRLVGDLGERF